MHIALWSFVINCLKYYQRQRIWQSIKGAPRQKDSYWVQSLLEQVLGECYLYNNKFEGFHCDFLNVIVSLCKLDALLGWKECRAAFGASLASSKGWECFISMPWAMAFSFTKALGIIVSIKNKRGCKGFGFSSQWRLCCLCRKFA